MSILVSISKYADLNGTLQPNLSGRNPIFYGIGPNGERRCLEEETLFHYESEHDYRSGAIVMRDGTRMATTSLNANKAGWQDVADMMLAKGLP
jgi:hypothetical protein